MGRGPWAVGGWARLGWARSLGLGLLEPACQQDPKLARQLALSVVSSAELISSSSPTLFDSKTSHSTSSSVHLHLGPPGTKRMTTATTSYPPNKPTPSNSDSLPLHSADGNAFAPTTDDDDFTEEMSYATNALNGHPGRRDKSGQSHPLKNLTPKRIAAIAAVLLLIIFYFGSGTGGGRKGNDVQSTKGEQLDQDITRVEDDSQAAVIPLHKLPSDSPQKLPNAGSRKCTPPPGQKEKTYALMIDAGSTGSRLHVYTFAHCDPTPGALPKLEDEQFYALTPGLSSFAGRPDDAAESLRPLLAKAVAFVPKKEQACTPIAVKATAGLRLTGEKESRAILDKITEWLSEEWPFSLVEDGVVVMEGKDEGVYAWITINFVRPPLSY